eukprot:GHUV01025625.1.p1 GENE.GHUV01025625.1~~GHUV01025625.1.p1  ORF type:complete len:231 (+),score=35.65 GHUV01025625.1:763-1455(+)
MLLAPGSRALQLARRPAFRTGNQHALRTPVDNMSPSILGSTRSSHVTEIVPTNSLQQQPLQAGDELDDYFTGLDAGSGWMTVAGFGSLLSERSARTTFPDLKDFRPGLLRGYRRVFTHTADIFFVRGIARPDTGEISSLSCEPCPGGELVVSLFEVPYTPESVAAFIAREHEFRFLAVQPSDLAGKVPAERLAVSVAALVAITVKVHMQTDTVWACAKTVGSGSHWYGVW